MHNPQQQACHPASFTAGVIIALSAIASIAAVALDSMASGHDPLSILQAMVKIRDSHQLVHVVAMACIGGLMYGFSVLSARLGLRRPPVLAALIAYGIGSMLMFISTIIDGFISTDLAALFVNKSPEAVQAGYWMFQVLEGVALTDIARVAWVCQSVAAVAWSIALLREHGLARGLGSIGLVCGVLPAVVVIAAGNQITAPVVVGILLVQAMWNFIAAIYLLRPAGASEAGPAAADRFGAAAAAGHG